MMGEYTNGKEHNLNSQETKKAQLLSITEQHTLEENRVSIFPVQYRIIITSINW